MVLVFASFDKLVVAGRRPLCCTRWSIVVKRKKSERRRSTGTRGRGEEKREQKQLLSTEWKMSEAREKWHPTLHKFR
jgi:hypothetical protein